MYPPNSDFALSSTGKADITASVEQSKTEFTYADGVRIGQSVKATGTVTAHNMTAGKWHGQYQFNVNLGKKAAEPTEPTEDKQWDVSANQDGSLIMTYEASTKTVTVSGEGDMADMLPMIYLMGGNSMEDMNDQEFMTAHMDMNTGNPIFDYPVENLVVEEGCTSIGSMSFAYQPLKTVSLPNGLLTINEQAFVSSNVKNIVIPNTVTSLAIGAFEDCRNLETIVIPDSVTSVGRNLFNQCRNLKSVTLGKGITEISESMFNFCENLTELIIPDTIVSIGGWAFLGCVKLTVYVPNSVTSIENAAFSYQGDQQTGQMVIYCQSQAVADLVTQSTTSATVIVDASKF